MREARETAEHANQKKAEFLAKMSHELRTPLNAIGGYASLILDGIPEPVPDAHQASLHRILKAQQHLLGLIETVLTHAKLEAGQMTYELDDVPMGEILDVVESLTSPQVSAKSLIYACQCDRSLMLRCDQQKVVQILLNLISNAVKFTPMNGRITLRTAVHSQGEVIIGVADTGIGMTAEQLSSVFEPFTQFDTQLTSQDHGTGLGLPISRELARGMGGELTVESHPGTGTEFLLRLPRSVPRPRPSSGVDVPSESRV